MSRREDIMAAIHAALSSIPGLKSVERNRTNVLPEGKAHRPAIVWYDGDEAVDSYPLNRPDAPAIVEAQPVIVGHVMDYDSNLGTLTNDLLAAAQRAVFTDPTIRSLCQPYGTAQLRSVATDIGAGRTGEGSFAMTLSVKYPLDPSNP